MKRNNPSLPPCVVQRLAKYLTHAQNLCARGVNWVSSRGLADALGLTSATVRQDLTHVSFRGASRRGYAADGLVEALARVLGADAEWSVVVVGAGNLGRSLALHHGFGRRGFRVIGIFDRDPRRIGRRVGRLTVGDVRELPAFAAGTPVDMGILAVPDAAAQEVAELLVSAGIRGLLNLAFVHIAVPAGVAVTNAHLVTSMLELSYAVRSHAGAAPRKC